MHWGRLARDSCITQTLSEIEQFHKYKFKKVTFFHKKYLQKYERQVFQASHSYCPEKNLTQNLTIDQFMDLLHQVFKASNNLL